MKKYKKKNYSRGTSDTGEFLENTYDRYTVDEEEGAMERPSCQLSEERTPRKKKKRKKKRYLLKFFILTAVCVSLYFFLHSSVFNIRTIRVSGNGHISAEQVQEMAGLKNGINLFEFKSGVCEDKLLENPYIKNVNIRRKLPSEVHIQVVERQEKAVLQKDRQYIVIDMEGVVLRKADNCPKQPLLTGVTVTEARENEKIAVKEKYTCKKALELLAAMEAADLYFKKIDVSGVIVRLYVTDKLICKGEGKNLLTGMQEGNLKAVLYDLYKKKIKKGTVNVGDDQYYSFSKKIK